MVRRVLYNWSAFGVGSHLWQDSSHFIDDLIPGSGHVKYVHMGVVSRFNWTVVGTAMDTNQSFVHLAHIRRVTKRIQNSFPFD